MEDWSLDMPLVLFFEGGMTVYRMCAAVRTVRALQCAVVTGWCVRRCGSSS
jgi:hypothetical protein